MSSTDIPVIEAQDAHIPQIGLGTWQLDGDVLAQAIETAAASGYRHFDTAPRYGNEAGVGAGLRATGLPRESYFLTTKVWHTELKADALRRSAETSVETLGLGPVDLLLVHWPNPEVPLAETIGALCQAKRDGLTRHIGVSNFPARLLGEALALADEPIVANQCECHPRFAQRPLKTYCEERGVAFVAYAPIGSGNLIADPEIGAIAARLGRSPAQVMLRWHIQRGDVAIPRSGNPDRIAQNIAVTDFVLSPQDMAALEAMDRADGRQFNPDWVRNWD